MTAGIWHLASGVYKGLSIYPCKVIQQVRACRECLERRDYTELAALMNANFDLRRRTFGDAVLGAVNLSMISTARSVGGGCNCLGSCGLSRACVHGAKRLHVAAAAAKFTGSGGAVVAYCPEGAAQEQRLRAASEAHGFTMVPVHVGPQLHVARASDTDEFSQV